MIKTSESINKSFQLEKEIIETIQRINRETESSTFWKYDHRNGLKLLVSVELVGNTTGGPNHYLETVLNDEPGTLAIMESFRDELKAILGGVCN